MATTGERHNPSSESTAVLVRRRLEQVPHIVWVVVLSALVLLPLIGSYGLWEPYEFTVADIAREVARTGDFGSVLDARPPLTVWLAAAGVQLFGVSELAARLPLALMGMLGALATYGLGARLRSPRAGLIAAIVLLASPLFVFESRQLTSDIGAVSATAIAMFGLVGLAWAAGAGAASRTPLRLALDAAVAVVGLLLGFLAAGVLVGVAVPAAAVAIAVGIGIAGRFTDDGAPAEAATTSEAAAGTPPAASDRTRQLILLVITGAIAATAVALVYSKLGVKGYHWLIGGAWRTGAPPATATYDYIVDQVAFGMFPWSALAPIAVLRLAVVRKPDRAAWGGILLLAWAILAYAAATFWVRKIGDLRFAGLAAIAVAIGVMLDDVLAARFEGKPERAPNAVSGLPLVAVFVLCAAAQLARDNLSFPDELTSVHILAAAKYPKEVGLLKPILAFGLAFGVLAAGGFLSFGESALAKRLTRASLYGAVGVSWLFGLFLALVYTPALSQHFSYKNLFDSYRDHKQDGERLGVMGIQGSGPDYYAKGNYDKLGGLPALIQFMQSPDRVFAISPAADLCALHQKAGTGALEYHVIDDRNSRFLLYSNRLLASEKDRNPLLTAIRRTPPETTGRTVSATYVPSAAGQKGKIELIGVDLPAVVKRGAKFKATLHFYVHENVTTNYKVFMHFDRGAARFNSDHDPIRGRCGTQYWQAGDYISDTVDVLAGGEMNTTSGTYDLWVGFAVNPGPGQWKNMTVTSGNADGNNRVKVGTITLKSSGGGCR